MARDVRGRHRRPGRPPSPPRAARRRPSWRLARGADVVRATSVREDEHGQACGASASRLAGRAPPSRVTHAAAHTACASLMPYVPHVGSGRPRPCVLSRTIPTCAGHGGGQFEGGHDPCTAPGALRARGRSPHREGAPCPGSAAGTPRRPTTPAHRKPQVARDVRRPHAAPRPPPGAPTSPFSRHPSRPTPTPHPAPHRDRPAHPSAAGRENGAHDRQSCHRGTPLPAR